MPRHPSWSAAQQRGPGPWLVAHLPGGYICEPVRDGEPVDVQRERMKQAFTHGVEVEWAVESREQEEAA